jgi:hypothetical protein
MKQRMGWISKDKAEDMRRPREVGGVGIRKLNKMARILGLMPSPWYIRWANNVWKFFYEHKNRQTRSYRNK